jgi:hypothetical protein
MLDQGRRRRSDPSPTAKGSRVSPQVHVNRAIGGIEAEAVEFFHEFGLRDQAVGMAPFEAQPPSRTSANPGLLHPPRQTTERRQPIAAAAR